MAPKLPSLLDRRGSVVGCFALLSTFARDCLAILCETVPLYFDRDEDNNKYLLTNNWETPLSLQE